MLQDIRNMLGKVLKQGLTSVKTREMFFGDVG